MSEALSVQIRRFRGEDGLPAAYTEFFSAFERAGATCGLAWLDNYRRARVLPGSQFRLYALEEIAQGKPLVCMPAVYSRLYAAHPRARVIHFLQPDGEAYEPIGNAATGTGVRELIAFLDAERPRCDVLRFTPLDPASLFTIELLKTLARAQWPRRVEALPPERFLDCGRCRHTEIIAARPGALRARLEAATRTLVDTGRISYRLVALTDEVPRAWEDYCAIVGDERFHLEGDAPDYIEGVMRVSAAAGTLRTGFLILDGVPAAVQVWRLDGANARCLRIWTDEAKEESGLSDLLTAYMTKRLIEEDCAAILYFGALSEEFAADWAAASAARIDVMAFNPRTFRGVRGAIRHLTVSKLRAVWRHGRRLVAR